MKKHHIPLKAKYKYVVIASDVNHSPKRPLLVAKLMDLNTTILFWLRMKILERATFAIGKFSYEAFGKNIVEWGRPIRA